MKRRKVVGWHEIIISLDKDHDGLGVGTFKAINKAL